MRYHPQPCVCLSLCSPGRWDFLDARLIIPSLPLRLDCWPQTPHPNILYHRLWQQENSLEQLPLPVRPPKYHIYEPFWDFEHLRKYCCKSGKYKGHLHRRNHLAWRRQKLHYACVRKLLVRRRYCCTIHSAQPWLQTCCASTSDFQAWDRMIR